MIVRSFLFLLLFSSGLALASIESKAPKEPSNKPLSFSMWKQKKIRSAHQNYQTILKTYKQSQDKSQDKSMEAGYQKVQVAYKVLQYSRSLKIDDYFEMYLADRFPGDINALQHAVEGMTKTQISELLVAYQKRLRASKLRPYEK